MRGRWDQIVRAVVHRPALAGEWLQDLRGDVLRPLSLASPCLEGLPLSKGEEVGEAEGQWVLGDPVCCSLLLICSLTLDKLLSPFEPLSSGPE